MTDQAVEKPLPDFPISEPIAIQWENSLEFEPKSSTYTGLRSIDELVPKIDGRYETQFICGGIIFDETPELNTRIDLKAVGASEVWIPLQGEVRKTLYFDFSR